PRDVRGAPALRRLVAREEALQPGLHGAPRSGRLRGEGELLRLPRAPRPLGDGVRVRAGAEPHSAERSVRRLDPAAPPPRRRRGARGPARGGPPPLLRRLGAPLHRLPRPPRLRQPGLPGDLVLVWT